MRRMFNEKTAKYWFGAAGLCVAVGGLCYAHKTYQHSKSVAGQNQVNADNQLAVAVSTGEISRMGTEAAIGGTICGGIGGAIGYYVCGTSAAAAAAPLGPVAMATAFAAGGKAGGAMGGSIGVATGTTIGAFRKPIWNGTKWIASGVLNGAMSATSKTKEACSIQ